MNTHRLALLLLLIASTLSQSTININTGAVDGDEANGIATKIGIILACVVLLILVIYLLYLCFEDRIDDGAINCWNICRERNTLKRYRHNYYSLLQHQHKPEDFNTQMGGFQVMLQAIALGRKRFVFTENNQQYQVRLHSVKSKKKNHFLLELTLSGQDKFGLWKGHGAFMKTHMGPLFWMLKNYNDKQKAGQVGDWALLVFESTNIQDGRCTGRWFFEGMEQNPQYSGTWEMV